MNTTKRTMHTRRLKKKVRMSNSDILFRISFVVVVVVVFVVELE
jgi:hypothetical protein